jgi:hypothetical protein
MKPWLHSDLEFDRTQMMFPRGSKNDDVSIVTSYLDVFSYITKWDRRAKYFTIQCKCIPVCLSPSDLVLEPLLSD